MNFQLLSIMALPSRAVCPLGDFVKTNDFLSGYYDRQISSEDGAVNGKTAKALFRRAFAG